LLDQPLDFSEGLAEQGGHGFGLINKTSEKKWFDAFLSWMSTLN